MRYAHLGSTGLQVSRICLGCMSYGTPSWRDWVLDEAASMPFFERAIDLQPENTDARYGLAILSLSVGDLGRAENALTQLYDNNERADDAAFYLGTIAEQREDYVEAQQWYQRVEGGSHAFESQVRGALKAAQLKLAEDGQDATAEVKAACTLLDRAASKNVLPAKRVARLTRLRTQIGDTRQAGGGHGRRR